MTSVMTERSGSRRLTLAAVLGVQFMLIVDASVVNLVLPVIQADLGLDQAALTWVVNAYMVAFGGFLLVAGRLGDLVGKRRVLIGGLVVFTTASAVCALAPSGGVLVAARFVQGVGGSFASAVILAIVATRFPEPEARTKAMSAYMLVSVGGGSAGMLIGGALGEALSWHWIFAINLPIGVAVLALLPRVVARDEVQRGDRRLDVPGAVLVTAGVMLGVAAIVRSPTAGWGSTSTLAMAAGAVVLLLAFAVVQRVQADPLLPGRLLRIRGLTVANAVRALLGTAMYGIFFAGALFLERVEGMGTLEAGVAFLPQTLLVAALSLGPTAWLIGRVGPFRTLVLGLLTLLAGFALLAQVQAGSGYFPIVLVGFALFGAGAGMAFVPLLTLALADVPAADAGVASALVNVSTYVAGAVGLAALGAAATGHSHHLLAAGAPALDALTGGYVVAFWIAAGCAVAGLALSAAFLRPRAA